MSSKFGYSSKSSPTSSVTGSVSSLNFSTRSSYMPLPATQHNSTAAAKRYKYLRRIFKFDQMDFEFAFWQMLYLLISPQKVYRNFHYRKKTKSQFARDDPAFLVLFSACLCLTSLCFSVVLNLSFLQFIHFLLYVIFIDCIGFGIVVATFLWFVLNKYFRANPDGEDVEWGFAFDVHLNAFFPPLILLHFFQLFFYNSLISPSFHHALFLSTFIGNTFWLVAIMYYLYITFLGYSSLYLLKNTQLILTPIPVILVFYLISLAGGFNITHAVFKFYEKRVV